MTRRTPLYAAHVRADARLVDFAGWLMPVQYKATGVLAEHAAVRERAGLFDVSHMGRVYVSGREALPFLQYALTNNARELDRVGMAQYTLIPDEEGGAIDDAYLYRADPDGYMLVVNAANRGKDWQWLQQLRSRFPGAELTDRSDELAMLALQGPMSERLLEELLARDGSAGRVPEPFKNSLSRVRLDGDDVILARTGYTGEPVGFELFPPASRALALWEQLLETGAQYGAAPVGLGALLLAWLAEPLPWAPLRASDAPFPNGQRVLP